MHFTHMFELSAKNHPNRLAFTGDGGDFTYREVQKLSNQIAHACLEEGIGKGAKFYFISPNSGMAMTAAIGAMKANAVWSNINLREAPETILDILTRGEADLVFYHSMISQLIMSAKQHIKTLKVAVCIDQPDENGIFLKDWIKQQPETRPDVTFDDYDVGLQLSTGGTTGRPKLAVCTHHWLAMSCLAMAGHLQFKKPPVYLAVAPNTHGGGIIAFIVLSQGGTVVMMATPDLEGILKAIPKHEISLLFLPPTFIYMLLKHPLAKEIDYGSLKYLCSSTAPLAAAKVKEGTKLFGPVMAQIYGQSESGMPVTFMTPEEYTEAIADESKSHRLESCGRQSKVFDALEIVDENDMPLGPNKKGEIVIKGSQVMRYYLNDEKETAEIQKNGWHHTGDMGHRDEDGYIYISDRKRDMIISGGYNIFPFEIEQVLLKHSGVQDCSVIGVPDEKWGEAVKAVVMKTPDAQLSEEELINICKEKLGSMKAPKSVDFVDELPKSAVGKVLKRVIREKYWDKEGLQVN